MSNNEDAPNSREFKITKKIAKHGSQAVIIVPRVLEPHLKPGTVAEVNIKVLEGVEEVNNSEGEK